MSEAMWREAEASGMALPHDKGLSYLLDDDSHGWHAALLFLHQALATFEELPPEHEEDVLETFAAVGEWPEPIWRRLSRQAELLPEVDDPILACEKLLPVAAQMEREPRDLHRLPFIGVAAEQEARERGWAAGRDAGEILAWLLLCAWALNASFHPSLVITCFSRQGALLHSLDGGDDDLDRYLLRAFLNNVPLLQASEHLARKLPRRASDWLFCDHSCLARLEATLREPRVACAGPQWPQRPWECTLGGWRVRFGPPLRHPQLEEVTIGLVETEVGAFVVEVHLGEGRPRLQPLPLHLGGNGELVERLELLQERLERGLLWAAAAQAGGVRAH